LATFRSQPALTLVLAPSIPWNSGALGHFPTGLTVVTYVPDDVDAVAGIGCKDVNAPSLRQRGCGGWRTMPRTRVPVLGARDCSMAISKTRLPVSMIDVYVASLDRHRLSGTVSLLFHQRSAPQFPPPMLTALHRVL
jgi:hypothetical protein